MLRTFTLHLFVAVSLLFTASGAFAQGTPTADTVVLGPSYANQVYYSLVTGQKTIADKTEWDVAFQANGITFGVWLNETAGLSAYLVPSLDATDWGTAVDTTGLSTWQRIQNGTGSWADGAFNSNPTSAFDIGWGVYTGPPAHEVNGDSIYLVKYANGTVKLLWIENLNVNRYVFRFSDIDGNSEVIDSVLKNNDRNLSYYSLLNEVELDREPSNESWDLWFTNGLTAAPGAPGAPLSPPAGAVYANRGIQSVRVTGAPADSADYLTATFDSAIYNIGVTYRVRNSTPPPGFWEIPDSNVYFVKANDDQYYKIVFTGFGGTPDGVIAFEKTQLTFEAVGINDVANATRVVLYPNPATSQLNVILDAKEAGLHTVVITDLAGKVTYSTQLAVNGLQNISIPVSTLANGYYLVSVEANGNRSVQKFVKQ